MLRSEVDIVKKVLLESITARVCAGDHKSVWAGGGLTSYDIIVVE